MFKFFILTFITCISLNANILQDAINKAKAGSTIKLDSGIYQGNITINKALTIIGKSDNVIIDGLNKDTVIQITSSNIILKNLTIINSGNRMDKIDAGIKISNSSNSVISNCTIKNTLYGIELAMVTNSIIENNKISSKDVDISLKGDALKLYYSNNNKIRNNEIYNSRDTTFAYSHKNLFSQNHIERSRFALHIKKSHTNTIEDNHIIANSVGLIFAGAKKTTVQNNIITNSNGKAGIAVLVKGVSDFRFKDNTLKYNNKAFYIDAKHNETEIKRFFTNNDISYNNEAFHFHGAIKQNLIKNNTINGNIEDVVKSVRGNTTSKNIVENNYWDKYAGFDTDGNNIGDTSYKMYQYADRLWHYNNRVKFFYATPIISIINFILNLAPFIEPVLLLEDKKPLLYVGS
ncbi:nitrous oxide reductase family maturation protein NosD [Poseidonibacter lekithochrous]|uniref:nitrous oxide reductase family maturation protein NosD n=1 Tax=Poseidonibacter lekithochrous TaxID=1904463 RepID=UPI0008FC8301|nr:nitrous oxide reductase family maturation protein NosD [Poseidonibacter lekithochrous]QKJ24131.1 NosD domain-containing protein [Poseidonibacter lekithochrous]